MWVDPYMTLIINGFVAMSHTVRCLCDGVRLARASGCGGLMVLERCAIRGNVGGADWPKKPEQRSLLVYGYAAIGIF